MNIKKMILGMGLVLGLVGCDSFIPRNDIYGKADFHSENIEKGINIVKLYELDYPRDYDGRIEFLREFEDVSKRLLLSESSVNIVVPVEFFQGLTSFKNMELLIEERPYAKLASDLDNYEQGVIDERVEITVTDDGGEIQRYLNKQVYFWMALLGREYEFEGDKYYTELDKQRLINEVKDDRREFSKVLNAITLNWVIKVDTLKATTQGEEIKFWTSKEIGTLSKEELSKKLQVFDKPIYFQGISEKEKEYLTDNRREIRTDIIIFDSPKYAGYSVLNNKYTFYIGGNEKRYYYKGYEIYLEIEKASLEDLLKHDSKIMLNDLLNRTPKKVAGLQEKQVQVDPEEEEINWGIK